MEILEFDYAFFEESIRLLISVLCVGIGVFVGSLSSIVLFKRLF